MASMLDTLGNFNYGGVGATATPFLTSGASNPVGAYLQASPGLGSTASASLAPSLHNLPGTFPTTPGQTGGFGVGGQIGMNLDTMKLLFGGLQSLGNIWMAWNANKLAKEQFAFQKDVTNANLANQVSAYNTTLEDRIRSRAVTEGQTPEQAQAYIDSHKLEKKSF